MSKSVTISDTDPKFKAFDLEFLKEEGIKEIQKLSGNIWTDYNAHDPGITILEALCFTISEVAMNAQELLGQEHASAGNQVGFNQRVKARPVTTADIVKSIESVDGVKRAFLFPSIAEVEYPTAFGVGVQTYETQLSEHQKEKIKEDLHEHLLQNRNLGKVYSEIRFFDPEWLVLNLDLELSQKADFNTLIQKLLDDIEGYLIPRFDQTDAQKNHGETDLHTVYISDLVSLIMKNDEVKLVKSISVISSDQEHHDWFYVIPKFKVPTVDRINSSLKFSYASVELFTGSFKYVKPQGNPKVKNNIEEKEIPRLGTKKDVLPDSIQHSLPKIFGVGHMGVSSHASDKAKAKVNQLIGYLSLFDQLISYSSFRILEQQIDLNNHIQSDHSFDQLAIFKSIPQSFRVLKKFLDEYLNSHLKLDDGLLKKEWIRFCRENESDKKGLQQITDPTLENLLQKNMLNHALLVRGVNQYNFDNIAGLPLHQLMAQKRRLLQRLDLLSSEKFQGPTSIELIDYESGNWCGLKNWIMECLGLRGTGARYITEHFLQLIQQGNKNTSLEIKARNYSHAVKVIHSRAGSFMNYVKEENWKISDSNANLTFFGTDDELSAFIKKIQKLNYESEDFYLVDHILLRPLPEFACHGLECAMGPQGFLFRSDLIYTKPERENIITILNNGMFEQNDFQIVEEEHRQFRIYLLIEGKALRGDIYFSSLEKAKTYVQSLIRTFEKVDFDIQRKSSFSGLFEEGLDPFSNMTTVVFPDWPDRFQNPAFRREAEIFIAEEFPASMVTKIKWLAFEEMEVFEKSYMNYNSALQNGDHAESLKTLTNLMNTLISL